MHYLLCKECVDRLGPGEEKCCGQLHPVSCDRCGKYLGHAAAHCMPQHAPPYFLASRPPEPYLVRMRQDPSGRSYGIEVCRYTGDRWQSFGTDDDYTERVFMQHFVILGPIPIPSELSL
jgi:hypothetical protein